MFATFVHNLDPIIFEAFGGFALRWYGMAYLGGFIGGYFLLKRLAERKLWVLQPEKTADFIAAAALLGVFLGGRLGYIFFYLLPRDGWGVIAEDPLLILRVWEGGMSSHGGILGMMIFAFFYARKHQVSWAGLGDGICIVAPIGIFLGRLANFVNGELYGRAANGVAWAMKFPSAFLDWKAPESKLFPQAFEAAMLADPEFAARANTYLENTNFVNNRGFYYELLAEANRGSDKVNAALEPFLLDRHPSQVYQALLEGLSVFLILWFVRVRFPKAPHGLITGIFFGLYATFRIFAEYFREPDSKWVIENYLTQGQFLSLFMYAISAAFIIFAWKFGQKKTV